MVPLFCLNVPFPSRQHYELGPVPEKHRTRYTGSGPSLLVDCYPRSTTDHLPLPSQASGASFGYMVVWIMSQRFLLHVHGERLARVTPRLTLTPIYLRALAEAAEVRAQRQFIFSPNGRVVARDVRAGGVRDGNGGMNLDVQVQIEQAVMVDYHPRTHRIPRTIWDRKQSDITNVYSPDRALWGLSRTEINKTEGDPWP